LYTHAECARHSIRHQRDPGVIRPLYLAFSECKLGRYCGVKMNDTVGIPLGCNGVPY